MIAITTEQGTLRIAGELQIPNGRTWNATRMTQLIGHIERFVFAAELADKDLHMPKACGTLPPRKPNARSGLVVVPEEGRNA